MKKALNYNEVQVKMKTVFVTGFKVFSFGLFGCTRFPK